MKRSIGLAALLGCGALLLATTRTTPHDPGLATVPVAAHCAGCEPGGVVALELLGSRVRSGVLEFSYAMSPRIDGVALEGTVDARGGSILAGGRAAANGVKRGERYVGDVRVALGNGATGGRVFVNVALAFPATGEHGATGEIETQTTQLAIDWGNFETVVDGATIVTSGDIVSLDLPAIREGGR